MKIGVQNEGLLVATGHYRNGILLAPVTAAIVAGLVGVGADRLDERVPDWARAFDPRRFERARRAVNIHD